MRFSARTGFWAQLFAADQESGANGIGVRALDAGDGATPLQPSQPPHHAFESLVSEHRLKVPAVGTLESLRAGESLGACIVRIDGDCAAVADPVR